MHHNTYSYPCSSLCSHLRMLLTGAMLLGACTGDDVGTASDSETATTTTGEPTTTGEATTTGEPTTTTTMGSDSDSATTSAGETETETETTAVDPTTTTGPACVDPEVLCGDLCVDPTSDPNNCGDCGIVCAGGEVCSMGTCTVECGGDTPDLCDGLCTDVASDPNNCGDCGIVCAEGELCEGATCVAICAEDQLYCGEECVDPQSDPNNCGDCGIVCAEGESCEAGVCAPLCDEGLLYCAEECVNPNLDEAHCGDCGITCADGEACIAGSCVETKVLVIGSGGVVNRLETAGYTVTSVGWAQAVANLDPAEYPVAFIGRYATNWNVMTEEIKAALDAYNQGGGALVTEWDGVSLLFSGYHNTYRYPNGAQSLGWFQGSIGAGHNRGSNTAITQVLADDPLFDGVNNPFQAGGATEFFFTFYEVDETELELMATFPGNGSANFPNGDLPTLYRGVRCGVNILAASWDYQDDANNPGFGELIPNFVTAALAPPSGNTIDVCP